MVLTAEIVSTGEELVLGATVDTNAAWLSTQLAAMGVPVTRHVAVGDVLGDIVATVREASRRAGLVLMTGGLGPTPDDLTREALAVVSGQPLVRDEASVEQIQSRFARLGRVMPPENLVQAWRPQGALAIANPNGTAPGIHLVLRRDADSQPAGGASHEPLNHAEVFAMPGVPREMTAMFAEAVVPAVRRLQAQYEAACLQSPSATAVGGSPLGSTPPLVRPMMVISTVNCYGAGESVIAERIRSLMQRGRNPSVGTNVREGVVKVRVVYSGLATPTAAQAMVEADVTEIRRRLDPLGPVVFGCDETTLEQAVGEMLSRRTVSVSVIESVTGGLLAAGISTTPGGRAALSESLVIGEGGPSARAGRRMGLAPGALEALTAQHGWVSGEMAETLAEGARTLGEANIGLGTVGVADPALARDPDQPVGLCYIGWADQTGRGHIKLQWPGERDQVRDRAVKAAVNTLRLRCGELGP